MCDRTSDDPGSAGDFAQTSVPASTVSRIELRTAIAAHADLYRALLGDLPGLAIVDGPLLDGCIADAAIAPTNSYGCLDAGVDGAFARRFGRRLQRALQERIGLEFDAEMPVGQAIVLPTGDFSLPYVVAAPATQFPGVISTEPLIYRALTAALEAIDRWNAGSGMPAVESVILPDIARIVHGWEADRLVLQLRAAIVDWRRATGADRLRFRAA